MNRLGEMGQTPERSSRYFSRDGYWYYTTREGIQIGPFDSEHEAQEGVSDFIDFVTHADTTIIETLSKYRPAA